MSLQNVRGEFIGNIKKKGGIGFDLPFSFLEGGNMGLLNRIVEGIEELKAVFRDTEVVYDYEINVESSQPVKTIWLYSSNVLFYYSLGRLVAHVCFIAE